MALNLSRLTYALIAMTLSLFMVHGALAQSKCSDIFTGTILLPQHQAVLDRALRTLSDLKVKSEFALRDETSTYDLIAANDTIRQLESETFSYFMRNKLLAHKEIDLKIKAAAQQAILDSGLYIDGATAVFHLIDPVPLNEKNSHNHLRVDSAKNRWRGQDLPVVKPFEVMATPVTNVIWRRLAKLSNNNLGRGYVTIKTSPSHFEGETLPVESFKYADMMALINNINELSRRGNTDLERVLVGHKKGDHYRLLTNAEMDLLIQEQRRIAGPEGLSYVAWFNANSSDRPHAVASKMPMVIQGKHIFDIVGNVWQWVSDVSERNIQQQPIRGGSWSDSEHRLLQNDRTEANIYGPGLKMLSFRLARDVRN